MKRLLIVLVVLSMASMANAQLYISVNGTVNPPDSAIVIFPGGIFSPSTAIIAVTGDGLTDQTDVFLILENSSNATMTGGVMLWTGDLGTWGQEVQPPANDVIVWLQGLGYNTESAYFLAMYHSGAGMLTGKLFDNIVLTCTGIHDVKLTLVNIYDDGTGNPVFTPYDTQIIHTPEPMTLGLLGLGGLFLRRRK